MMFNCHNTKISSKALIGKNVRIGDNTIIFDNVIIEDNVTIAHNCVIGEPLNEYYSNSEYENPETIIGANSLLRSHSVIYAGNKLGEYVTTGHRVTLRENNQIGHHTVLGTNTDIQGNSSIGNYCRFYNNVTLAQFSTIGNFVFLYAFTVMLNDPYPPSEDLKGAIISDYTLIAVRTVILSGVKVGTNCLIGANSVVKKNIPDYSLAMGNPANTVMDIRKFVVVGQGKLYPWMYRYSKGMPWEQMGYDEWLKVKRAEK